MKIRQYQMGILGALGLAFLASPVAAQHAGHSDVEAEITGGQFVLDNELVSSAVRPGLKIYESEFGELGNDFGTDDPGFEIDDGNGGNPGEIVALEVKNTLMKWTGSDWVMSGFDEFITIEDLLGNELDISGSSITGTNVSIIDEFDGGGGLHSHVEFEIGSTSGTPMDGAYLLELSMFGLLADQTTPVYTPSDNFLIVFHLDAGGTFDEEAFEMAVDSLAPVPIPAAVYLLGGAVALLGRFRRGQKTA